MQLEISFLTPLTIVQPAEQAPEYLGILTLQIDNFQIQGENMASTLPVGKYMVVSVQWVDMGGNPAPVHGATKWQSSDPTVCECTVATGNPLIANLHAPGGIGPAQIQATADADLGEGTKTITATLDVTVIAGEASAGTITPGPVSPKGRK